MAGRSRERQFEMDYLLHILVLFSIYSVLAISLDLVAGHARLLSLSHAAFYGLGAYSSAMLVTYSGSSFLLGLLAGMVVAGAVSFLVSLPSLRMHDDYFVIATFAFQMIVFSIFNNWTSVTHGPMGIPGIPRPLILGWRVDSTFEFVVLGALLAALAWFVVRQITTSPMGRVLHAIREDEVLTASLGKPTLRFKLTTFGFSAAIAALAGSFFAHYITYVDPTSFTIIESILVLSMVIIGGAGSLYGPLIGAAVLVALPEGLRFAGLPSATAANLRQIFYGLLLILFMVFRPQGLIGEFGFRRR